MSATKRYATISGGKQDKLKSMAAGCLAAAILAAGLAAATPAAGASRYQVAPAVTLTADRADQRLHQVRHWKPQKQRHWRHRHHRRPAHRQGRPRHRGSWDYGPAARACHPVQRINYFHGRKALVGGILCYDRRGRGYVLRGSRHIIRYLYR